MLKLMVDYDVMFYVMGVVAVIGICSKMVSGFTLKRLVQASSNMNKSTHKLMKLMRAKYEHACMVSDRVQNINAFVDKYVYEYRVLGLRLHMWQHMQKQAMWMSVMLGALGAGMYYQIYGMGEPVYRYAGTGAILMMLLFLLQLTTDERYLLKTAEVYMIDYLENVCAHRYEKMYQKESAVKTDMTATRAEREERPLQEPRAAVRKEESMIKEAVQVQDAFVKTAEKTDSGTAARTAAGTITGMDIDAGVQLEKAAEEADTGQRESIIREILEEFLAQRT